MNNWVACFACSEDVLVGTEYYLTPYWSFALKVKNGALCGTCSDRLGKVSAAVEPETQERIRKLTTNAVVAEVEHIRKEAGARADNPGGSRT
jgi:hypothetical protein